MTCHREQMRQQRGVIILLVYNARLSLTENLRKYKVIIKKENKTKFGKLNSSHLFIYTTVGWIGMSIQYG